MWRFDYSAHLAFIAPARKKAQLWRTIVGLVLIIGVLFGLGPLIYIAIFEVFNQRIGDQDVAAVFATLLGYGAITFQFGRRSDRDNRRVTDEQPRQPTSPRD